MNYNVLEELCEKKLLDELAAGVFETTKVNNNSLKWVNREDLISIEILNNFIL